MKINRFFRRFFLSFWAISALLLSGCDDGVVETKKSLPPFIDGSFFAKVLSLREIRDPTYEVYYEYVANGVTYIASMVIKDYFIDFVKSEPAKAMDGIKIEIFYSDEVCGSCTSYDSRYLVPNNERNIPPERLVHLYPKMIYRVSIFVRDFADIKEGCSILGEKRKC